MRCRPSHEMTRYSSIFESASLSWSMLTGPTPLPFNSDLREAIGAQPTRGGRPADPRSARRAPVCESKRRYEGLGLLKVLRAQVEDLRNLDLREPLHGI